MGFGLTSPVSGLAPIQIGWSGTLVPLKGTTLADGNDHKSHRESAGFQRQQGRNQTGRESNAKVPASAGRGRPRQVGLALSLHWGWPTVGLAGWLVGGWVREQARYHGESWSQVAQRGDEAENTTKGEHRTFSLLGALFRKAERVMLAELFCAPNTRQ